METQELIYSLRRLQREFVTDNVEYWVLQDTIDKLEQLQFNYRKQVLLQ